MSVTMTKPRVAMLKQIAEGKDYLRYCGSMGARSAAKRVCMALVELGLLRDKTERRGEGTSHPWTCWLGYELTQAGREYIELLSASSRDDETTGETRK